MHVSQLLNAPGNEALRAFLYTSKRCNHITAPVVLASVDVFKGKKLTGYWNIQVDLK